MSGDEEILEGCWDCTLCGATGIGGNTYSCTTCNVERQPDVKFYLPSDAKVITDPGLIKIAKEGPDWYCKDCSAANLAPDTSCYSCHRLRALAERTGPSQVHSPGKDDASGTRERRVEEGSLEKWAAKPVDPPKPTARRPRQKSFLSIKGVPLLIALAIVGLLAILGAFHTSEIPLRVAGHTWERIIHTEVLRTLIEEDWSVPSGGRVKNSYNAIHHHEPVIAGYTTQHYTERVQRGYTTESYQSREITGYRTEYYSVKVANGSKRVQDGYNTESLGNGKFRRTPRYRSETTYTTERRSRQVPEYGNVTKTRQVPRYVDEDRTREVPIIIQKPVFSTRYVYEVDRWVTSADLVASGNDVKPQWPVGLGEKRESGRAEKYKVRLVDDKQTEYSIVLDGSEWEAFKDEEQVTGVLSLTGLSTIKHKP